MMYNGSIEINEQINTNKPYLIVKDAVEGTEAHVAFYNKEDVERFIERLRYTMLD